jgi:dTDP-4-amino-4,6-dideoxygalactose transaminase
MIKAGDKPKAVIVVHLYGQPAKMDPIIDICKKHDIYLIEDATESLGSKYKGEMTGSFGDISCFSFNGNKLITTGGGGMLVTNNKKWSEKARYLTTQAKDDPVQFIHNEIGYNYRLTNIQAAMGVAQLEQIEDFIEKKRKIAKCYFDNLNYVPGITITKELDNSFSNYWISTMLIDEKKFGIDSKELYKKLREKGIMVRPFFKPIHQMPMYIDNEFEGKVVNELWEKGVCLPASVGMTEEELKYVVKEIKKLNE